jgi:hypothetical protein
MYMQDRMRIHRIARTISCCDHRKLGSIGEKTKEFIHAALPLVDDRKALRAAIARGLGITGRLGIFRWRRKRAGSIFGMPLSG